MSLDIPRTYSLAGKVVGWEYRNGGSGGPIKFSVFRLPDTLRSKDCYFTLVGFSSFSSSVSGYDRIDLSDSDYISVKAGDYIAVTFTGGSSIR